MFPFALTLRRSQALTLAALLSFATQPLFGQVELTLPPMAAHVHVASADTATGPLIVSLASLGTSPGDCLRLRTLGGFDFGPGEDEGNSSIGLFSADSTVLDESFLNRVPGAIEAGDDWITSPTYYGTEPTDIPEDFRISGTEQDEVIVTVPVGANYLLVSLNDTLYKDNSDPNGDYRVEITEVGCWFDVGPGLAGTAGEPHLNGAGLLLGGDPVNLELSSARPGAGAYLIVGASEALVPFKGGVLVPSPDFVLSGFATDGAGEIQVSTVWPAGLPGDLAVVFQFWVIDPLAPLGAAASQGLECVTP